MSIPKHAVTVELDVPFSHCDPLQVVWHGRYFEYLEAARTKLLRSIDLDAVHCQELGYKLYVVDARIRYMKMLRYGDVIRCTAWFSEVTPHIRIAYLLDNLTSKDRAARAHTVIATTTPDGDLLSPAPDVVLERLPVEKR